MKNYCPHCHQADDLPYPCFIPSLSFTKGFSCPNCSRKVVLVTIPTACELVCKSRKTIYHWISTGRVTTVRGANGRLYIYCSSLFLPPVTDE